MEAARQMPAEASGALARLLDDPAGFFADSDAAEVTKRICKMLFDELAAYAQDGGLSSLFVDGFDAEQIWGQLDMQAGVLNARAKKLIRAGTESGDAGLLTPEGAALLDQLLGGAAAVAGRGSDATGSSDGDDGDGGSDRERSEATSSERGSSGEDRGDDDGADGSDSDAEEEDGDAGADVDADEQAQFERALRLEPGTRTLMQELAEMNDFVKQAEREAGEASDGEDDLRSDGGGSTEPSEAGSDGEEEDGDDDGDGEGAGGARKRARGLFESDSESGGSGDGAARLSRHQRQQAALRRRIAALEEANAGEKPWELRGEVDARSRPVDSALEVDLDFEQTLPPVPAPTEELAGKLEDVIRRRCAEERWDDVVRVAEEREGAGRRARVELDDRKSERGLGDIYADDYVARKTGGGAEDPAAPLHEEARALFARLCAALDALSHNQFAPALQAADLEPVRVSVPAVELEEVAPVAAAGGGTAAPEEVHEPSRREALGVEDSRARKKARRKARGQEKAKRQPEKFAHGVKVVTAEDYNERKNRAVPSSAVLKG